MKKLSAFAFLLTLAAINAPAQADDFGARFGSTGATALQDTSDADAASVANIQPAAGDSVTVDAEATSDAEELGAAPVTTGGTIPSPATLETDAAPSATLDGPSSPEPTPQQKTESSIIHFDQGMSPDRTDDASYRMQDPTH